MLMILAIVALLCIWCGIMEASSDERGTPRLSPDEEFAWIKSTSPGMTDEEIQEIVDLPWSPR